MITVILQDGTGGVTTSAYPGLPATITVPDGTQVRGIVRKIEMYEIWVCGDLPHVNPTRLSVRTVDYERAAVIVSWLRDRGVYAYANKP